MVFTVYQCLSRGMEDVAGSFMDGGLDFELAEKPTSAESIDIVASLQLAGSSGYRHVLD